MVQPRVCDSPVMPEDQSSTPKQPEDDGLSPAARFSQRGSWQPPSPEELNVRLPQYEVTEMLGRGGMGAVYKGWQKSLGRFVAIKILPPGVDDGDENFVVRFKREAKSLAQLSHPGIIHVHDAGEKPDGLLYFVMDFVSGTDVHRMLASRGRLPAEEALGIIAQVLDALAYAHGQGVIHRDIKPANVMIDSDGSVKIADFGLAKNITAGGSHITSSNMSLGTPDFMAPEAQRGAANVDHRADIYAVGVMLYEMLIGQLPRGRFEPPSRAVPGLDKRLDRIVDRALQSEPDARFATAAEFRAALAPLLSRNAPRRPAVSRPAGKRTGQRTVVRRKTTPLVAGDRRRRPLLIGIIAVIVLGIGCMIAWKNLHPGLPHAAAMPAVITPGAGGDSGKVPAAESAPWINAFTELPLKNFTVNAKHSAKGWLLPMGNHWKYPAEPVLAGALRVRATSEDSSMILNFHHDDGGASGGAARVFFRPGTCILAYNTQNGLPNTRLAEKDDVNLGDSTHDFLLVRIAGKLRVVLDGRTIIEAADPNPAPGRFSLECGSDNRLHVEKAEYLILDGMPEARALKLAGLPPP